MERGLVLAVAETRGGFSALFFDFLFSLCSGEWNAVLAECAEMCQHYFSIFGRDEQY
jgi:hypothetical protein